VPVPIIVLTNGRPECISKTIPSAHQHLSGVDGMVIIDASFDDVYGQWLEDEFIDGSGKVAVMHLDGGEPGYWRAMQATWRYARYLLDHLGVEAAFFLEDDFTFNADVDLDDLVTVLDAHPYLTQIALRRQPWFHNEVEAGGLIEALEAQGEEFTERTDGERYWIEHRACFTGNPSLIPRATFEREWPEGDWSESRFGGLLFRDEGARGAYWGRRTDPPLVEHIGHHRVGTAY
jgi:hypothetical protein